jgi:hypothetical protein
MFLTNRGSDISELFQLARFLRAHLMGNRSNQREVPVVLKRERWKP